MQCALGQAVLCAPPVLGPQTVTIIHTSNRRDVSLHGIIASACKQSVEAKLNTLAECLFPRNKTELPLFSCTFNSKMPKLLFDQIVYC